MQSSEPEQAETKNNYQELYKEYLKPVITEEELLKVCTESKPQHALYIEKSANIIKELEIRITLEDWKELHMDPMVGIQSWQRTTQDGFKSLKCVFDV